MLRRVGDAWDRVWHKHSLIIVLGTGFTVMLVSSRWMLEYWPGIQAGEGPQWAWWAWETIVSNEADVFGAIMLIYLTKKLHEVGSPESGDEEMEEEADND